MKEIEIHARGMSFQALADGPDDGPLLLLLHGLPRNRWEWHHQIPAMAQLGFRAVSAVAASSANTECPVPDGATFGGRVCATPGFGDLTEAFTSYSEDDKEFVFEVNGMPSFITLARNHTTVRPAGPDRSEVQLEVTMDTNAVGKLMGPLFAIKLKSTLNTFLDELAAYVELGEVSSKKRKQLAKAGS